MVTDSNEKSNLEFQIVSETPDNWDVRFRIHASELLDQQGLLRHLRAIKHQIAQKYGMSETCMLFDGIIQKTRTHRHVDVIVRIKKVETEKGDPAVHLCEGVASDGALFPNMIAMLDICYRLEDGTPVTLEMVRKTIYDSGVDEDQVDWAEVNRATTAVLDQQQSVRNIVIARGIFPDIGDCASVEYLFPTTSLTAGRQTTFDGRRVVRGEELCRKVLPTLGRKSGLDVLGHTLPRRPGLDIPLRMESGASLSIDGTDVIAEIDGVAVITPSEETNTDSISGRSLPSSVSVKVSKVMLVEGAEVVDITTSHTVEVVGNLAAGSRILTSSEVFVDGNVSRGVVIEAGDDVTITGYAAGATITGEAGIVIQKDAVDSNLHARGNVLIGGAMRNSAVAGDQIAAETAVGSKIIARHNVVVDQINADENGILSSIRVGMHDFFRMRVQENELFIAKTRENLTRIEMIVGPEIVEQVNVHNTQAMLMKYLSSHRITQDHQARKQVDIYRRLIESIAPTKALILHKQKENRELLQVLGEAGQSEHNSVIIRRGMDARTLFSVDGAEEELSAMQCPASISRGANGHLSVERMSETAPDHPTEGS